MRFLRTCAILLTAIVGGVADASPPCTDVARALTELRHDQHVALQQRLRLQLSSCLLRRLGSLRLTASDDRQILNIRRELLLQSIAELPPVDGRISSRFGSRIDPISHLPSSHSGEDIAAVEGSKVSVPADGRVLFAGRKGDYGNCVVIDHGAGVTSLYAHLLRFVVKAGDSVKRRQQVGNLGTTGRSTGPHLHFEVHVDGAPINLSAVAGQRPRVAASR